MYKQEVVVEQSLEATKVANGFLIALLYQAEASSVATQPGH